MRTHLTSIVLAAAFSGATLAQQNPSGLVRPKTAVVQDNLSPLPAGSVLLTGGLLGDRFSASERNRLMVVSEDELLDAFENRDTQHQVWMGEHVGKYLHAACITWKTTGDAQLKAKTRRVAYRLMATQEQDGYLGTYPPAMRWTAWDVWVHKYDLLGLLTYYQYTHDEKALQACRKIGGLMLATFGPGRKDINKAGEHIGMASDSIIEPMVLLYRATGERKYLDFAKYIVKNYDAPGGPRIIASLEKTGSVHKVANGKAYEMLSNLNGLLELYRVTGEKRLLKAVLVAWKDVAAHKLYITGSASSGEHFHEDYVLPHGESSSICETCVTTTWLQMNLHLLRLTGEAKYADQIERTTYNHLLGAQKSGGDQWCYYTPLEGQKPYGNATSCCLSSGPRGVALLPSVAVMVSNDGGLNVNLYNNSSAKETLKGVSVASKVQTRFPSSGEVLVYVDPSRPVTFALRLRLASWCASPRLFVNGRTVKISRDAKGYAVISRRWTKGDVVRLDVPLTAKVVYGDHGNTGKAAVLYGPVVMAMDTALNPWARLYRQVSFAQSADIHVTPTGKDFMPIRFTANGLYSADSRSHSIVLSPYYEAGQAKDSRVQVWIPLPGHAEKPKPGDSLFHGGNVLVSRHGNQEGDIADDDPTTFRVTYDATKAEEDWYEVSTPEPVLINRVVFIQGRFYHDGGWFDTSTRKPRILAKSAETGQWVEVGTLDDYPAATGPSPMGVEEGQTFEVRFPAVRATAIRVVGTPGYGDNSQQAFSSCAELQGFLVR